MNKLWALFLVALSRKISIIRNASDGEISSDNEDSELQTSNTSDSSLNIINTKLGKVPPEILEKIMKKGASKSAKRIARVAHLKRVRNAQGIRGQRNRSRKIPSGRSGLR